MINDKVLTENLADLSFAVQRQGWDWLHINSAMERSGKSSFALDLAKEASKLGLNFDWSPKLSHVFFYEPKLDEKMLALPNKSVAIIDEGAEVLFSRKSIDRLVIKVIQTLMVYGSKNIFLIINIPDWRWIDKYIRQSRVRSLSELKTYPRMVLIDGRPRMVRARGFYRFYTRNQVVKASKKDYGRLGRPVFSGHATAFAEHYPEDWKNYLLKKKDFLLSKAKTSAHKKAVKSQGYPELSKGDVDLGL